MRRAAIVLAITALALGAAAVPAVAQEVPAPAPPVANCGFLSAVVCQVPVTVGPFNIPVDIGSVFAPPPATP